MFEVKTKTGKKFKVKDITLDERDGLLDGLKYDFDKDGNVTGMNVIHSTMTKWFRLALEEGSSDEFILSLKMEDRSEIFTKLMSMVMVGEENASD